MAETRTDFAIQDKELDARTEVVSPSGEIDLAVARDFGTHLVRLVEAGKTRLVLDFTKVSFLDSTALGVLLSAHRRARQAGGALAIVALDDNLRRIFELTGLDGVFQVFATRDAALLALNAR